MNFTRSITQRLLLTACCCSTLALNKKYSMSQNPLLSQVLRGQYENKIRRYSPPEKIFDVFATIYENGQLYMTLHDLLRAICFYNYSVSDDKQTVGFRPETILQLVGNKQKFQIYDYFILVRFLAFEKKKCQQYFQENVDKKMSKTQFRKYLREVICSDYEQFIKPPIALQSRQFKPDKKSFQQSIDQTVQSVFKVHPQGFSLKEIISFRRNIIRQIFSFQFLMFKLEENKIDGTDFARSIIKYVESSKRRKYMNRVQQIKDQIEKVKIGQDAYVGFHYYMQTNLEELRTQLSQKGVINTEKLYELINKYVTKKRQVTKQQVGVLMKILDLDDSGFIEKRQFLGVLENLQYYTQVKSGQLNFTQMMYQDWNKIKDKAKRIYEILQE